MSDDDLALFREIVADLPRESMIQRIGEELDGELASAVARLA